MGFMTMMLEKRLLDLPIRLSIDQITTAQKSTLATSQGCQGPFFRPWDDLKERLRHKRWDVSSSYVGPCFNCKVGETLKGNPAKLSEYLQLLGQFEAEKVEESEKKFQHQMVTRKGRGSVQAGLSAGQPALLHMQRFSICM